MCKMYRIFFKQLYFENYLLHSNYRDRISLSKLRCANSKLPIYKHIYSHDSDVCTLCNLNVCGDEYDYVLIYPFFINVLYSYFVVCFCLMFFVVCFLYNLNVHCISYIPREGPLFGD